MIVRREYFAGDFRGCIDNKPAELAFKRLHLTLVFERRGLLCLGHNLFGRSNRFLLFALRDMCRALTRLIRS